MIGQVLSDSSPSPFWKKGEGWGEGFQLHRYGLEKDRSGRRATAQHPLADAAHFPTDLSPGEPLASELPLRYQRPAIRVGLALAYLFRVMALVIAGWLTANTWVRWLGSAYLIWLMSSHLTRGHAHDVAGAIDASHQAPGDADTE